MKAWFILANLSKGIQLDAAWNKGAVQKGENLFAKAVDKNTRDSNIRLLLSYNGESEIELSEYLMFSPNFNRAEIHLPLKTTKQIVYLP